MEQEAHFTAQAPMLIWPEFIRNATEQWDQVKVLRRIEDKPGTLGFQKATYQPSKKKITTSRTPYNKETRPTAKGQIP